MQNMVEYEEDTAGIYVSSQTSSLKYGLWINTTKNPRLKTVEFPKLGISIEVTDLSVFHVKAQLSRISASVAVVMG